MKRALEFGLSVERDANGRRLEEFLGIYEQTMDRRSASTAHYYFGRPFFERLIAQLPQCIQFFHVLAEGRVVSTELCFVSPEHVYSFVGGTLPEAFELRANDLLNTRSSAGRKKPARRPLCSAEVTAPRTASFATSYRSLQKANARFASGRAFSICRMRSLDGSALGLGPRAGARFGLLQWHRGAASARRRNG